MTNLKSLLILSLFAMGLLASCVKEETGITDPITITPESQEIIETSLYGIVIDNNDQPVANALVTLNTGVEAMDVMTDDRGHFAFEDIENKGASAFLSIKSAGKFEAFRRYGVIKNRNNYTEVKMQDKDIIGTVAASQGGTLDNGNGAEIELPANGIINASGAAYTGDVSVAMAWIDPSAADLASQMVGDLSAIDMEGNRRSLATYGMLQIELLDQSGNELNIANGSTATLQFPVPAELQGNAPSTIPLWSYDEEVGTWIEEGRATFANGVYRGSVTHFSSWNVDFMYDPIEVTGQVKVNIEGEQVDGSYLSVYVKSDKIGKKGGWLCDDGSFRFYNFPKGEQFKLCILDQCGNVKFEETYGPFENDEDLGTIEVMSSSSLVQVKGNALNCDGAIVENGSVTVDVNGRLHFFEMKEDGSFDFALDICKEGEGKVTLVDLTTILKKDFEIDDSQAVWELTDAELCDELADFVSASVNGMTPVLITPGLNFRTYEDSTASGKVVKLYADYQDTTDNGQGSNRDGYFEIRFAEPTMALPETIGSLNFTLSAGGNYFYTKAEGDIQVTVTGYDNQSGGFIKGTFTGTVLDEINGADGIPITGEFRVPID